MHHRIAVQGVVLFGSDTVCGFMCASRAATVRERQEVLSKARLLTRAAPILHCLSGKRYHYVLLISVACALSSCSRGSGDGPTVQSSPTSEPRSDIQPETENEITGLVVESVLPDSPAAKARIQVGERLLSYDGKPLIVPDVLSAAVKNTFRKEQVQLHVQGTEATRTVEVPLGGLGVQVRPELPPAVLERYELGQVALEAKNLNETVAQWTAAAKVLLETGELVSQSQLMAAWLHARVGELHEAERNWREAERDYTSAWDLLKQSGPGQSPRNEPMAAAIAVAQSTALSALGRCSQNLNDFQAAQRWCEQAIEVHEAAGNQIWLAGDLTNLGSLAGQRGDMAKAHDYLSRAVAIYERIAPDSLGAAIALTSLGNVFHSLSGLAQAHDYFRRALAICERLAPDSLHASIALNGLGNVALACGDLAAAYDYYLRTLSILERLAPESLNAAGTLKNLGTIASTRGDLLAARDLYGRALEVEKRLAPHSLRVARSLMNLGTVAFECGDLKESHGYLIRALAMCESLAPNSLDTARILNNLGSVALIRGDSAAARDYYDRAQDIQERLAPDSLDNAASLMGLGNVARVRGELAAAREYHRRALEIEERLAPHSPAVATILNNLGIVASESGELSTAKDYFLRALQTSERLAPNSLEFARALCNLGCLSFLRNDSATAQDYLSRAAAIWERLAPDSLDAADNLHFLGHVALEDRRLSDALDLFTRAVTTVESHRRQIASPDARSLLTARHTSVYADLVRTHLALDDALAAFATVERARARSLVEMLAERAVDFSANAPKELLDRQRGLQDQRDRTYRQLSPLDPKNDARIDELHAEISSLSVKQRQLTAEIRAASPLYASLEYPQALDLAGARAALDQGTLLLAYFIDDEETYLFAVTNERASGERQPTDDGLALFRVKISAKELKKSVADFRQAIREHRDVIAAGQELYDLLVRPAQALIEAADRVLICPDGVLHTLPFQALVADRDAGQARYFADLRPLHTILSATVYAEIRKQPRGDERGVPRPTMLAFGDPDFGDRRLELATNRGLELVSRPPATGNTKNAGASAAKTDLAPTASSVVSLGALVGARAEVAAIKQMFGDDARFRLGTDATELAAKTESGSARILHFACHGLIDDRDPLASGLALMPSGDEDGILRAWEIFERVRVNADLVVLSACQTGLGETTKHEGVIGLTRALQYAGARSIVVSLWSVSDESTVKLMKTFYAELRAGTPKDLALQRAQAAVRANPKWQHPFYWAPFMLVGDWRPLDYR
jgi:CHAT domain-containing protein/Flp pilus assembly protein TadD